MILALDLGSSSFKAAVFGRQHLRLGQAAVHVACDRGDDGRAEMAVETARAATRRVLAAALDDARCKAAAIRGIGITSQAQTFAVFGADGRPHSPFFSWQDTRSGNAGKALHQYLPDFAEHCSFADVYAGLQVCQCRRLAGDRGFDAGERIMPLPSFVVWELCNRFVLDENLAAMSGLYSLRRQRWWMQALLSCGLQESQLPAVVPLGEPAATTVTTAREWGLPVGCPVVLAGNDQTAGAIAARLRPGRDMLITLGTAQVAYVVDRKLAKPTPGTVRGPYPGGLAYRLVADDVGGGAVDWAAGILTPFEGAEGLDLLAATAPVGARGVRFSADLATGTGYWRDLGLHHQRGDLARAVFEGLAQRLAGLVRTLGGVPDGRLLVAGGGRHSVVWRASLTACFGRESTVRDDSPLEGVALLTAQALERSAK